MMNEFENSVSYKKDSKLKESLFLNGHAQTISVTHYSDIYSSLLVFR